MADEDKKDTKETKTKGRRRIAPRASKPKEAAPEKKAGRPKKEIPFVEVETVGIKVEKIPLDQIDLDDKQFRFRVNLRVGKLAESIRENGQQLPVFLRRRQSDGKLQIVSGFRRITAIDKLGWGTVNAIVRTDLDEDVDAAMVSILENEARQTYNDLDRAYAIIAYREMGKKTTEIQEIFKLGKRQVLRLQKLTTFPSRLQDAVAEGRVTSTNAVRLMQHASVYEDTDVNKWIDWLIEDQPTTAKLNAALRDEVAEKRESAPIEFFVRKQKGEMESLRIRPISIDKTLSEDQRKALLSDLQAVMEFVEGL